MDSDFNNLIFWIFSPELQVKLFPLKIFLLLLCLFFISFCIFFLFKSRWLRLFLLYDIAAFFRKNILGFGKPKRKWKKIKKKMANFKENDYKEAIVELDKIMGQILKNLVPLYQCRNFEERLPQLNELTIPNIMEIWKVHKLSKKILSNPDYKITLEEGKGALETYERAFQHLEII